MAKLQLYYTAPVQCKVTQKYGKIDKNAPSESFTYTL